VEVERSPISIEQWYKCATNLDRHWRKSKEDERMMETRAASFKAKQSRGTAITTTTSLAKEIGDFSTANTNRTYSNRRNGKNKYSSKKSGKVNRTTKKRALCNGCRQREELLQLWKIWTLSKELWE